MLFFFNLSSFNFLKSLVLNHNLPFFSALILFWNAYDLIFNNDENNKVSPESIVNELTPSSAFNQCCQQVTQYITFDKSNEIVNKKDISNVSVRNLLDDFINNLTVLRHSILSRVDSICSDFAGVFQYSSYFFLFKRIYFSIPSTDTYIPPIVNTVGVQNGNNKNRNNRVKQQTQEMIQVTPNTISLSMPLVDWIINIEQDYNLSASVYADAVSNFTRLTSCFTLSPLIFYKNFILCVLDISKFVSQECFVFAKYSVAVAGVAVAGVAASLPLSKVSIIRECVTTILKDFTKGAGEFVTPTLSHAKAMAIANAPVLFSGFRALVFQKLPAFSMSAFRCVKSKLVGITDTVTNNAAVTNNTKDHGIETLKKKSGLIPGFGFLSGLFKNMSYKTKNEVVSFFLKVSFISMFFILLADFIYTKNNDILKKTQQLEKTKNYNKLQASGVSWESDDKSFVSSAAIDVFFKNKDSIFVRATMGSKGYDLKSFVDCVIKPHKIVKVPTGVFLRFYDVKQFALLFSRSGLSSRGINLANGVGLIDSDYTKEVFVALMNNTNEDFFISKGDRIAQLVFVDLNNCKLKPHLLDNNNDNNMKSDDIILSVTNKRKSGFGSTGI